MLQFCITRSYNFLFASRKLICKDALKRWASQQVFASGPKKQNAFIRPLVFAASYVVPGTALIGWFTKASCKQKVGRTQSFGKKKSRHFQQNIPSLTFSEIWSLIRPYIAWFFGAIISAVAVAVLNVRLPLILGDLINEISDLKTSHDLHLLTPIAAKLVATYAAQAVLTFVYISLLSVAGEKVAADLRCKLFSSLIKQDIAFFDAHRTGELMSRLASDVQEFKSAFKLCISVGLRSIMQTGGCIVSLYLISPKMTTITVVVLPLVVGAGTLLGSGLRALSRKGQEQAALAMSLADEALGNIRTVRAFAMEDVEQRRFEEEVEKTKKLAEYLGVGIGVFQAGSNFALNGVILAVLYGGSKLIAGNEMSPGDLMSFMVTAQTIQNSMAHFSILFGQTVRGWTAGGRVYEYIREKPTIPIAGGGSIPFHALTGEVTYNDVSFTYPTRPDHVVLDKLNLKLKPGQVTAMCGPSGEGKSTIAALLERFYDVQEGKIMIDEMEIRDMDPKWLRGHAIGFISQEPVLFAASIMENIRYAKPDATDQEVYEAAALAHADMFVRFFPKGYETLVGERGVQLSGGQKQRVAIARALLKNPSILILDEATSALDAESERLVKDAMDIACKGRTVLIIAHRLSTIQNADQIAVICRGRVEEIGMHSELMKKKGMYYQMIRYQQENT